MQRPSRSLGRERRRISMKAEAVSWDGSPYYNMSLAVCHRSHTRCSTSFGLNQDRRCAPSSCRAHAHQVLVLGDPCGGKPSFDASCSLLRRIVIRCRSQHLKHTSRDGLRGQGHDVHRGYRVDCGVSPRAASRLRTHQPARSTWRPRALRIQVQLEVISE